MTLRQYYAVQAEPLSDQSLATSTNQRLLWSATRYGCSWPGAAGSSRFLNCGSSFRATQSATIMVEGEQNPIRIQLPLVQINADTVCLVRRQFQQMIVLTFHYFCTTTRPSALMNTR